MTNALAPLASTQLADPATLARDERIVATPRQFLFFLLLAFAGAWLPWWGLVADPALPTQIALPGLIAPAVAALLTVAVLGDGRALRPLLQPLFRFRFGPPWWLLAAGTMPATYALAALTTAGGHGIAVVAGANAAWFLPASFAYLIVVTAGEEIGWRGFAVPCLLGWGMGPAAVSAVVGVVWGVWHLPLRMASTKDGFGLPLFLAFTLALSPIYTVLRMRTASLIPALLLHATTDFMPRVIDMSRLTTGFWVATDLLLAAIGVALLILSRQPSADATDGDS